MAVQPAPQPSLLRLGVTDNHDVPTREPPRLVSFHDRHPTSRHDWTALALVRCVLVDHRDPGAAVPMRTMSSRRFAQRRPCFADPGPASAHLVFGAYEEDERGWERLLSPRCGSHVQSCQDDPSNRT